jgi:putative redox protein
VSDLRLIWKDGFRFTGVDSWGNVVALDADEDSGTGAKPADLLPISLAACTAYDIVNILRKQRQGLRALEAEVHSIQEPEPPWTFTRIEIRFIARGDVDATKARKALDLSEHKYCSVAATLSPVVEIVTSIDVEPEDEPGRAR